MGKICSHGLLCASQLHTPSCCGTHTWVALKSQGGGQESLYGLPPPPKLESIAAAYFFQTDEGSRPNALIFLLTRFPPLNILVVASVPMVPKPSSASPAQAALCLGAVDTRVFAGIPLNMCKSIPHFVPRSNSPAWFPNIFQGTGSLNWGVTFYLHSLLTYCSLNIKGQSQIPPGGIWPLFWQQTGQILDYITTWSSVFGKLFWPQSHIILSHLNHSLPLPPAFIYLTNIFITFTMCQELL